MYVLPFRKEFNFMHLSHGTYIATELCNQWKPVASGRGERRNVPSHPEIGKIVVEIWCYLPEVYTFGAESEIQEIFSKKL